MARRFPQPFYREFMKCWYVQVGKKQIKLSPDKDEAYRMYFNLMGRAPRAAPGVEPLAAETLDAFLDWCQKNRAPATYVWYLYHLQLLVDTLPPGITVPELKPLHLTAVMGTHAWSNNSRYDFLSACQRALNWAVDEGRIEKSPFARVKKPAREARERVVSPAEYSEVMGAVTDPGFRCLIELAWETGARVQELRKIEARFFDGQRIVFPPKESKGKKHHRVIYLTDSAREILAELCKEHPEGPVLRNSAGNDWTKDAINCAFVRLEKKLGKKLHLGAFRKGFATEALKAGVDTVTVAHLMGHRDPSMISRVYGQVQQDPEHMANSVRKARGQ